MESLQWWVSKPRRVLFTVPNIRKFINSRHGFHLLRLFFFSSKGKLIFCVDKVGGCNGSPAAVPLATIQQAASGGATSQMWAVECRAGGLLLQLGILSLQLLLPALLQAKCRIEFYRAPVRSGDSWMPAHTLLVEFRVLHALLLSQIGLS